MYDSIICRQRQFYFLFPICLLSFFYLIEFTSTSSMMLKNDRKREHPAVFFILVRKLLVSQHLSVMSGVRYPRYSLSCGKSFPLFLLLLLSRFSHVWLIATPWITARQASLSIINSRSLPKLMSIESVMPSSHLILSSPSSPVPSPSQHQGLFQWVNFSHEVAKVLEFQLQLQSFQWTPRTDLL